MHSKVIICLALAAVAVAASQSYRPPRPQPTYQQPITGYGGDDSRELPAKYDFDWAVSAPDFNNNFGQTESRDGDSTKGSYFVDLPDGRTQKVTYYVDGDSGFVADVTYEGEARYDEPRQQTYQQPRPQPTYQQPRPQPTYQQPRPQPTYQQPRQPFF